VIGNIPCPTIPVACSSSGGGLGEHRACGDPEGTPMDRPSKSHPAVIACAALRRSRIISPFEQWEEKESRRSRGIGAET